MVDGQNGQDRPAFGPLLRHFRVAAGLAQETLAERARISVQAISALERGHRKTPQRQTLTAILRALDLDDESCRQMEAAAARVAVPRVRAEDALAPSPTLVRADRAIPAPLNAFFGRERELSEATALMARTRLLTIAGPGGMGKTRFALTLVTRLAERFVDGSYFVELQPVADPSLVASAILEALSLGEEPLRPNDRTLIEYLRDRSVLLVVDSCEHLREACANILERLLRACPRLGVVTTTRIVLSVAGETTYRLSSLSEGDAVDLFVERARAASPTDAFAPADAALVAGIVRRLDGIPLAVELAAARTRVMSLETLDRRLAELLRESGDERTQPTLRAALDWSYDYLSPDERTLFERFAVFAGSWTLEAAESVCGGSGLDAASVLDLLTRLVDHSLLQMERHGGATRFRYLDTVRAYALEKFAASPARESVRDAHVTWFLTFVESLEPELYGAGQLRALEQIGREIDNLRSALDGAQHASGSAETALRLTAALWRYWLIRNNFHEGLSALATALERSADAYPGLRARNLVGLGSMRLQSRDYEGAWTCGRRACELAREAGDERTIVHALSVVAFAAVFYPGARDVARDGAELDERAARANDPWIAALPPFTAALRALRDANAQEANDFFERARAIVLQLGAPYEIGTVSCQLGYTRLHLHDASGAADAFFESARHLATLNNRDVLGLCTEGLAYVAVELDRMSDAAELFGAAQAIREMLGGTLLGHRRPLHERFRAIAIAALGEPRFDEGSRAGFDLARQDSLVPIKRFESAYGRA